MNLLHRIYPMLVGVVLGLLQSGLFFQLTFTLSSSFRTFLLITICWLLGSAVGTQIATRIRLPLNGFLVLALVAYGLCGILLVLAPFNTQIWLIYAALIFIMGMYPGVFFVRMRDHYRARALFFRENNGFILGLVLGTVLFIGVGRASLWIAPVVCAVFIALIGLLNPFLVNRAP